MTASLAPFHGATVPAERSAHGGACADGLPVDLAFDFAYQPIVDVTRGTVWAVEALVRGPEGQGARWVLDRVAQHHRDHFDQACRVKAIQTAAALGLSTRLSLNVMPQAVCRPELCLRSTMDAAAAHGLSLDHLVLELTEGERIADGRWLACVLRAYQRLGLLTAIDDFGAGYAGLALLADFQPDIVKVDIALVRGVDGSRARQAIARGVLRTCQELGITVIAEGIESVGERDFFAHEGVELMQGFLFSRPVFRALAAVPDPGQG